MHKPQVRWRETEPREIDRFFFARCRMEPAWSSVDFTVDISDSYERKRVAIAEYASLFQGDPFGAPNPFLSLWLIQVGTEDPNSGLAHLRRRSCSLVGGAGMAPPAPGCAHLSVTTPTPVGGEDNSVARDDSAPPPRSHP